MLTLQQRKNTKILSIDDDPTVLKLIERTFRELGYIVFSSLDSQNGLAIARKERPELIILDVLMPEMDGFAVLKKLKEDPLTMYSAVIMLTVKRLDADVQKGLDLGADDYVSKPIHTGLMVRRVENILMKVLED